MRPIPLGNANSMDAYRNQAKVLVRSYLLADPYIPYTAVLGGIIACKMSFQWYFPGRSYLGYSCPKGVMVLMACDLTHLISIFYFKCYSGLTKIQRTEWNNRGMSTIHSLFITTMSLYFVFWSDLFSDHGVGLMTFRSSALSTFTLGVSVGYFLSDLAVICWFYPSLGGMEYVIHHSLSGIAVAYSMISGEGQLYTFMVLISEVTTPEINMRWFLETAGMKNSLVYLINGVLIFLAWLVARILLFGYLFYHVFLHYHQIIQMHIFGYFLVFVVPIALAVMNLRWFTKIVKGVKKTLSTKQRTISV